MVDIERFICAFDEPYEGAKTFLNDKEVKIKNLVQLGVDAFRINFSHNTKGINKIVSIIRKIENQIIFLFCGLQKILNFLDLVKRFPRSI